jgi:TonB family protein
MPQGSDVLSYLASVTARSLVLFLVAGAAVGIFRVKAAAARHALWTVVAAGMLTLAALSPVLPPLPLRVLKPASAAAPVPLPDIALPSVSPASSTPIPAPAPAFHFTWRDAVFGVWALGAAIFLARLGIGYLFTRRLVGAAAPISGYEDLYSSTWISVPMTVGRKVLLPADWDSWDRPKLDAVLAHERTHVCRADWSIALIAGVNRALFWFNPLAWWLERHLAALAEQACDDSALLLVDSRPYAQALLDMAAAVRTSQGRLVWEAIAMANAAEVRSRIERILDETRQIPRAVTRARWAALLALSLPMIWIVSVTQLAPAAAQEQPKTPAAMAEYLKGRRQLSPSDVATMEQYLVSNPQDLDVRSQVVMYYYANGIREPRLTHILWFIANHPESSVTIFASQGVLPRDNAMNTYADYGRVEAAWKQAVATHPGNVMAILNAARFLQNSGEFEEAEKLLVSAGALGKNGAIGPGLDQLAKLYTAAILGATGDAQFPNPSPSFAARVRNDLESSDNAFLLRIVGSMLTASARRPQAGQSLPPNVLNLDDHPLMVPAIDLGDRLLARAQQLMPTPAGRGIVGGVPGGVSSGVPGGVIGGIIGGVPASPRANEQLSPTPPIVKSVPPQYPPLARQARISGIVNLSVTIATDGTVKNIQVINGHPLLIPAALNAVKQWVFAAQPAETTTKVEVPFTLPPGDAPPTQPLESRKGSMLRIGSNVQEANLIHKVDPVYPPQARTEGIQGNVTLEVTIDETGQVVKAEPLDGSPVLAGAAQDAVRQWAYRPTLLNGTPVEVKTTVIVPFRLP